MKLTDELKILNSILLKEKNKNHILGMKDILNQLFKFNNNLIPKVEQLENQNEKLIEFILNNCEQSEIREIEFIIGVKLNNFKRRF